MSFVITVLKLPLYHHFTYTTYRWFFFLSYLLDSFSLHSFHPVTSQIHESASNLTIVTFSACCRTLHSTSHLLLFVSVSRLIFPDLWLEHNNFFFFNLYFQGTSFTSPLCLIFNSRHLLFPILPRYHESKTKDERMSMTLSTYWLLFTWSILAALMQCLIFLCLPCF